MVSSGANYPLHDSLQMTLSLFGTDPLPGRPSNVDVVLGPGLHHSPHWRLL